jgi:cytochrome c oxidase subunit IV
LFGEAVSQHVVPVTTYVGVFVALLLLLACTVAVAVIEHPIFGLGVALTIAGTKAALIMLFFMHLRWDKPTTRLAAIAGFMWLAILIGLSLSDLFTRSGPPASESRVLIPPTWRTSTSGLL